MVKVLVAMLAVGSVGLAQFRVGPGSAAGVSVPTRGFGAGPVGHGFGNVVFPGGTSFPQQLGATVRGGAIPGYHGVAGRGHQVPVAVPVFVGGYGYGYGYAPPSPGVTIINQPPASPSVIINQNYVSEGARPVMRDYTSENLPRSGQDQPGEETMRSYQAPIPSVPEPPKRADASPRAAEKASDKPTIYLIAFKDGAIYPAYAFWVEGDTLHYITNKYSHNRANVDLVDAPLSEQLNRERSVEFEVKGSR
ncbi:MAG: hypothetical protein JJE04_14690 [Acidobacteriia bacterium]|nr:hypothetical protein [Terriglobia bacterium]